MITRLIFTGKILYLLSRKVTVKVCRVIHEAVNYRAGNYCFILLRVAGLVCPFLYYA